MNDKPYKLSELVRCLENYEKIYGDIPVRFIDNDGNINDIFNVDLATIVLEVEEELFYDKYYTVTKHINSTAVNFRSTFDYSTFKKEEEEVENEDQ